MLQNNPVPSFSIEVSNGAPDPASDDERELPESSQSSTEALPPTSAGSFAGAVAENKQESDLQIERFEEALKKQGLEMVEQEGDGNCLFRAVSLQVYGSADNHAEVRERCMDFMARNEEHYSNFVAIGSRETDADAVPVARAASAFQDYVARKRIIGVHGNHAEIQAISELFNRPIEVYTPPEVDGKSDQADPSPLQPMNFHAEYKTNDPPIRLSFHDGNHYNAVIDPLVPTAGLGLGLPGLKPGLADQLQITKAKTESDQLADEAELQRILKESHDEKDDELQRVLKQTSMDYVCID
jgi:OTU domain-containing protein 5